MSHTKSRNSQMPLTKGSVFDYLDEGRLTDWLSMNGKNILYGLGGLLILLTGIYILSSSQNNKGEQDYLQAANDFTFFSKAYESQNPTLLKNSFEDLQSLMTKHPEFHAIYDGALAQILLNRNLIEDAKPYATATLHRVKPNDFPFYMDYAETSILISQKDYKIGLEKAQALQKKMNAAIGSQSTERSFGDEIFALNLLRIGMLQQELGEKDEELQTWQEWKRYAGLSHSAHTTKINPQAFRTVMQQLAVGAISLPDYIAYRESALKK